MNTAPNPGSGHVHPVWQALPMGAVFMLFF